MTCCPLLRLHWPAAHLSSTTLTLLANGSLRVQLSQSPFQTAAQDDPDKQRRPLFDCLLSVMATNRARPTESMVSSYAVYYKLRILLIIKGTAY
jgi:hypothetical protein